MLWAQTLVGYSVTTDRAWSSYLPPVMVCPVELSEEWIISEVEESWYQEQWSPHLSRVQGRTVTKEINHQEPAHAHSPADFDEDPQVWKLTSLESLHISANDYHPHENTSLIYSFKAICQIQISFLLYCSYTDSYINLYMQSFKCERLPDRHFHLDFCLLSKANRISRICLRIL